MSLMGGQFIKPFFSFAGSAAFLGLAWAIGGTIPFPYRLLVLFLLGIGSIFALYWGFRRIAENRDRARRRIRKHLRHEKYLRHD